MRRKVCTSFDAVIDKLGGDAAVGKITGRSAQSICNWRARGYFPTVLVDVIEYHLQLKGYSASRRLFRLEQVRPIESDSNDHAPV